VGEASGARGRQPLLRLSPGPKRFTRGTHRLRQPAAMLASVLPLLPLAGVTRLANITGLDRIGIPVVVGVRPNGRILSQSAGKGITLELATLSAAMEGIELFHAEFAQLPELCMPYVELAKEHAVVPLEHLPLSRHSIFSPLTPERWTLGYDLLSEARSARLEGSGARGQGSAAPSRDEMVAVPLDLVVLPLRTERVQQSSLFSFQATSNGLASGAAFVEALAVGLLEVIERDAIACCQVAAEWFGQPTPRVRLDSARDFPLAHELLEQLQQAGVQALVYDCTVDTEVPVYRAVVYDAAERRVGLAEGWGAHLDPELALVRALTEAIQARAVSIAGARDDRFGRERERLRLTDSRSRIAELEAQPATVDLHVRQSLAAPTFKADVERILACLIRVGVEQVIVVDLTMPEFRDVLSVVRVVVPMLDGPGFEHGHPSPRATAFAARAGAAR
jgi:ribosomal protein S12 methylthiotransferase accessory factor